MILAFAVLSLDRLHVLHYFADLSDELELFLFSDVVDDAAIDDLLVLPEHQPLNILTFTFWRICSLAI
jgi:hypothetical protein